MSDLIDKTAALKIAQDIGYLDHPDSIAYAVSDAIAALPADPRVEKLVDARREGWNAAIEAAAKVADGYHQRALEWAKSVRGLEKHIGETDSSRIAAAIHAMRETDHE